VTDIPGKKMMQRRSRISPNLPLNERLRNAAEECRNRAKLLKPGAEQYELLEKARQFEAQLTVNHLFMCD
jgi:hypothetical protein